MKAMTLKKKLLAAFLFAGLVPVFSAGAYLYWQSSQAIETEVFSQLAATRTLKTNALQNYFKLLKNQTLSMAHEEQVKEAFEAFESGFHNYSREQRLSSIDTTVFRKKLEDYYVGSYGAEYKKQNAGKDVDARSLMSLSDNGLALQYAYIADNEQALGSKHLLDSYGKGKSNYHSAHTDFHPNMREFLERFELYDIFLIDGPTGDIVYSVYKELDFATSLKTGPYSTSGLARVYRKAMELGTPNDAVMEDYSTYTPSYDGPAGFIAAPIWINGQKRGVLAFQISFDKINTIALEKTGSAKTLETFLVGSDFKMRSDSQMDSTNRNVRASFRNPETGSIKTEAITRAIGGETVERVGLNYLNTEAVISVAPFEVLGNRWVIQTVINADEAFASLSIMRIAFGVFLLASAVIISLFAAWFARTLSGALSKVTEGLRVEAEKVATTSVALADLSTKLSEATTEQAASLQETVASIDEISAMISRNADSASTSTRTSETSNLAARKGKEKVELMLESISAIANGNQEIIDQMQKSNREISEIVKVIEEISIKTQVINEIVFQTKLLSFNASVEAARAGEHGKGFAVVAEEVGNLASMSGKAATEITEMLGKSVNRVTVIVDGTKGLMESLIRQSKEKVEQGTSTAHECAQALDEILVNVSTVNEMVCEIATASKEQSQGVTEVNKAMSELDQVTQSNSASAMESSHSAGELKFQAEKLNQLIDELRGLVAGEVSTHARSFDEAPRASSTPSKRATKSQNNVVPFRSSKPAVKTVSSPAREVELKKASGISGEAPSANDPRFEDV